MSVATTCDTSVLVPALLSWHPDHAAARRAVAGSVDTVPAHVLLECYSVLTRLPAPHRLAAQEAAEAVGALPWKPLALPAGRQRDIVRAIAREGVRGGAVYDALVAATALHHDRLLLTRDRRARSTYDVIGVRHTLV